MTDQQLQLALAKMLPVSEKIKIRTHRIGKPPAISSYSFYWGRELFANLIKDTEWLHVCWLVERALTDPFDQQRYLDALYEICNPSSMLNDDWNVNHASWQQRAEALCRVKGITI